MLALESDLRLPESIPAIGYEEWRASWLLLALKPILDTSYDTGLAADCYLNRLLQYLSRGSKPVAPKSERPDRSCLLENAT